MATDTGTVEGLIIDIEADASSAASQLEIITQKITEFRTAVSSARPLATFARNLNSFNESIKNIGNVEKLNQLVDGLMRLNYIQDIKIPPSLAKNLESVAILSMELNDLDFSGLERISTAMRGLQAINGVSVSTTIATQLERIANVSQNFANMDFSKLRELTEALQPLGNIANVSAENIRGLSTSVKQFSTVVKTASTRGRTFNTVLANIRTRTLMVVMAIRRIGHIMQTGLSVYGDYIETLNLFSVSMGEAAEEAYNFAQKCQDALGIDLTQWMKAQGVFQQLATGFGITADRATIMSQNLTQLAYDISSFYNIDVESAITKVQSGFAGQLRPLRALGYDLSQARLEAIALSYGIDKDVSSMTQAEKASLRYVAMLTQVRDVQGDLARTLNSPINQMRILQAQVTQMERSLGQLLLPILNKIIPVLNAIFRVIKMILDEIAAMFGYELPGVYSGDWSSNVIEDIEGIGDELDETTGAAEKLKNTLASFDQINLITSKSGGSGAGAGAEVSGSDFDFDLPTYDFLGGALENKAKELADSMMQNIRPFVEFLKDSIKWTIDNIDHIIQLMEVFAVITLGKKVYDKIKDIVKWFKDLNTTVAGIGLITIGLQFSYTGGEDMAKGNWLTGILKSTLGAAASALGFSFFFGASGIVIGIGVSLLMSMKGFTDQKKEDFIKSCDEIFFALREGRQSVEEFNDAWSDFINKYTNTELSNSLKLSDDMDKEVQALSDAVGELQMSYISGNITASAYASVIGELYTQMADTIVEKTNLASEAIRTALSGELGEFLQKSGIALDRVNELMDKADENIVRSVTEIKEQMQTLIEQFNNNEIAAEAFNEQMNVLYDQLGEYGEGMAATQAIADNFVKSHENLINFTGWDDLISTVQKVKSDYTTTMESMTADHDSLLSKMEEKLKGLTGTEREEWLVIIEKTKEYMQMQKDELTAGYEETLRRIEETGYINWLEVYNVNGMEGAIVEYQNGVGKLNDEIQGAYDELNKTREQNAFTYSAQIAGMIAQDEAFWESNKTNMEKAMNFFGIETHLKDYDELVEKGDSSFKKIAETFGYGSRITKKYGDEQSEILKGVGNTIINQSKSWGDYVNTSDYYASVNEERMRRMARETDKNFKDMSNSAKNGMEETGVQVEAKIRMIGDMLIREDWCVDPMYKAMWDTANVLKQNGITSRFSQNAVMLMGGVANDISGAKGNIQRAYSLALTPAENQVVDIGVSIGDQIRQGMVDSSSAVKEGATELTKGMAQAFNTFGDKAYQFFADLANLGAVVLGGMGATVSDSTFNNKFKAPKIRGYASGGFPDSADFFYANENGVPEYVGTLGGRTAVATNTDIVKGVSDGVYKAIKDTGIQNDVKKLATRSSKVVFAPSEEAGKVMVQSVNMYNGAGGRY